MELTLYAKGQTVNIYPVRSNSNPLRYLPSETVTHMYYYNIGRVGIIIYFFLKMIEIQSHVKMLTLTITSTCKIKKNRTVKES